MSEPHSFIFLKLPAELRLLIYRFLAVSTLGSGVPSDLWGLYISCKTIHDEIENEVIEKTGQFFDSQSSWNAMIQGNAPLRIHFPWVSSADFIPRDITIEIPECAAWVLRDGTPHYELPNGFQYIFYELFDLPVSVLTISCYLVSPSDGFKNLVLRHDATSFSRRVETMRELMRGSRKTSFDQASRFIVKLGTDLPGQDDWYLKSLLEGKIMRAQEKKVPHNTKRVWLANDGPKESSSWIFGYDFEVGLPKISKGWKEVGEWSLVLVESWVPCFYKQA